MPEQAMSVVEAVTRDLASIRTRAPDLADSALAALALALATELDDTVSEEACEECGHVQSWTTGHNSATSKSMCARALIEALEVLRELAPPPAKEADSVDELEAARAARRAAVGSAGT